MAKKFLYNCFGGKGAIFGEDEECENCGRRGLRCVCSEGDAYRRLQEDPESEALEMTFYRHETDDADSVNVVVEKNICIVDLCQLICIKSSVSSVLYWNIVEYWVNKGAERVLEDHEYMLAVQYEMKRFTKKDNVRYIIRQILTKYDILEDPKKLFRTNEITLVNDDGESIRSHRDYFLESKVSDDACPTLYSSILIRKDGKWEKTCLILKDGILYLAPDETAVRLGLQTLMNVSMNIPLKDPTGLTEIGRALDFHIYSVKKKKNSSIISFDYNPFILRPNIPAGATSVSKQIYRFGSFSENTRLAWISAMRLAKYGKQIRENYRAFKNKQSDERSTKDFGKVNVPNPIDPRIAEIAKKDRERHLAPVDLSGVNEDQGHLAYLDFTSGHGVVLGDAPPGRNRGFDNRSPIQQARSKTKETGTIAKLTRSIRQKLSAKDEGQPSTSSEGQDKGEYVELRRPVSETEQAKRFGAIRKILNPLGKRVSPVRSPPLERTGDQENVTQRAILERKPRPVSTEFPDFAMVGPNGEFIEDFIPKHKQKGYKKNKKDKKHRKKGKK